MTHKHIGGPGGLGKSLGKWVTCPTTPDKCRLKNTLHVEVETLKEVRTWTGKRSFNEVTVEDYQDYLKSYLVTFSSYITSNGSQLLHELTAITS